MQNSETSVAATLEASVLAAVPFSTCRSTPMPFAATADALFRRGVMTRKWIGEPGIYTGWEYDMADPRREAVSGK
jgi:hypothetical protein